MNLNKTFAQKIGQVKVPQLALASGLKPQSAGTPNANVEKEKSISMKI